MFDDVFGMTTWYTRNFRNGVRDSFGASIIADVLDPILKEVYVLRVFSEEFEKQSINIDQILEDVRNIQFKDYG